MKTITNSITKSLIRLGIVFGLLIAPVIVSAGSGDVTKKDTESNTTQEADQREPLPLTFNSAWYNLPVVEVFDEEAEIENWMKDVHDPFWEEVVNGEPEEEIENWMVNPDEWESI